MVAITTCSWTATFQFTTRTEKIVLITNRFWEDLIMLTRQVLVPYIGGLAQDCSNSSLLAMELLQSCT